MTMLTSIFQPTHLLIILVVALVFLGPKRLPEAGKALGQGLKEFRSSITSAHDHDPALPTEAEPTAARQQDADASL
jgi:sec-independent protein translocase protein TatA